MLLGLVEMSFSLLRADAFAGVNAYPLIEQISKQ
jgi:hypothetical protein